MSDPLEPKVPPDSTKRLKRRAPPVLVPVTAEDMARKTRRTILALSVLSILAIAAVSGWIYKRSTDPIRAQQSFDAAQRLFAVARYNQAIVSCDRAIGL